MKDAVEVISDGMMYVKIFMTIVSGYSSNIKVITSTISYYAVLVLLMVKIY
jgi:hypothetical protein